MKAQNRDSDTSTIQHSGWVGEEIRKWEQERVESLGVWERGGNVIYVSFHT